MAIALPVALTNMKDSVSPVLYLIKITGPSTTYRFSFPSDTHDGTNAWSSANVMPTMGDIGQSINLDKGGNMFQRRGFVLELNIADGFALDEFIENSAVELRVVPYDPVIDLGDSVLRWSGVVSDLKKTRKQIDIICDTDEEARFGKLIPENVIDRGDFPRADSEAIGQPVPILYGDYETDIRSSLTLADRFQYDLGSVLSHCVDTANPDGRRYYVVSELGTNGFLARWSDQLSHFVEMTLSGSTTTPGGGLPAGFNYVFVPTGNTRQVLLQHPIASTAGDPDVDAWFEDVSTNPDNSFDGDYQSFAVLPPGASAFAPFGAGNDRTITYSVVTCQQIQDLTDDPNYVSTNEVRVKVQFIISGDDLDGPLDEYVDVLLVHLGVAGDTVVATDSTTYYLQNEYVSSFDIGSGNYAAVSANPQEYMIVLRWYVKNIIVTTRTATAQINITESALAFDLNYSAFDRVQFNATGADGTEYGSWIDVARSNGYNEGEIIQQPAYIIESVLRDYNGQLETADIDVASFDVVGDAITGLRDGWISHVQIHDQRSVIDILEEALFNYACGITVDCQNRIRLTALNREVSPSRTIYEKDLLASQEAELEYTDMDMIFNQIVLGYAPNHTRNTFQKHAHLDESEFIIHGSTQIPSDTRSGTPNTYTGLMTASQSNYSLTRRFEFEADWITDDLTAILLTKWLADWLAYRRRKVTLTVSYLHALDIELLDQVTLALDVATGVFIVTSWNINLVNDTMTLELLEMRELP